MPTSVIQAMMAGCPVVATATGGTPEVVIDEQTGLLVPAASPDAMTRALRRLLEDGDLRERLADGGRRHAMANHREDVATARIEAMYDALVP
jgi:glycosyltransferase involved in cell wall biosynthesis